MHNLRNKHKQKIINSAFSKYQNLFQNQEDSQVSFNILQKIFMPKTTRYIKEFQRTQPFMPTTKFPSASVIKQNLEIHADHSTNITGVYVDDDGLVILDFDNIDDWERIGFPKGSVSKGISINTERYTTNPKSYDISLGNIRFFAHGLLYPSKETLEAFDKCSQKGSRAMLSFSYGGRSDLNGFFSPIGIIADLKPQNIIGGQNNWDKHSLSSGFKKTLDNYFLDCWIKNTDGFAHRELLADLTKSSTGMDDNAYIKFIKKYSEKPLQEIEPKIWQKKIMKAFADLYAFIGGYKYDEIYGTEPVPMGIFADTKDIDFPKDDIIKFAQYSMTDMPVQNSNAGSSMPRGLNALREYALNKDIPLVIFNMQK